MSVSLSIVSSLLTITMISCSTDKREGDYQPDNNPVNETVGLHFTPGSEGAGDATPGGLFPVEKANFQVSLSGGYLTAGQAGTIWITYVPELENNNMTLEEGDQGAGSFVTAGSAGIGLKRLQSNLAAGSFSYVVTDENGDDLNSTIQAVSHGSSAVWAIENIVFPKGGVWKLDMKWTSLDGSEDRQSLDLTVKDL